MIVRYPYPHPTLTLTLGIPDLLFQKYLAAFLAVVVLLLSYFLFNPKPPACDMSIAENRKFNHFYGITGLKNHFTTPTADACDAAIVFHPALSQSILKPDDSASSFSHWPNMELVKL